MKGLETDALRLSSSDDEKSAERQRTPTRTAIELNAKFEICGTPKTTKPRELTTTWLLALISNGAFPDLYKAQDQILPCACLSLSIHHEAICCL